MLSPFGWLYGKIADFRNALYDKGIFTSHDLEAKTISIGNITAGGTGKTPLVALVAEILADDGEKVCILTRGYGRKDPRSRVLVSDTENIFADAQTGGDEPVELAGKLLGKAIILADANRVSAAEWAKENFGITAFVLDDGFQHRRAKRDLDIVCIDATDPFGGGKILPAGKLREPLRNLRRANAFVITRANLGNDIQAIRSQISEIAPDTPIFVSENHISRICSLTAFHANDLRSDENSWEHVSVSGDEVRVAAFCALGNAESFFEQVRNSFTNGFQLIETKAFPDHHFYSSSDIESLERRAKKSKIDVFVTTAKDAVKLREIKFNIPCFVVMIEPSIDDAAAFKTLLTSS